MTRTIRKIVTLLAWTLAVLPAWAQDVPPVGEPEEEELRRYTVEVIIFSYEENVAVGSEIFPPDQRVIDDISDTIDAESSPVPVGPETGERAIEIVPLDRGQFTMTDIARRFARLDVYKPVMHFGWTQVTHAEEDTPPIALHAFGRPPMGLDGSFTLYLSRFLHLVVDLKLQQPGSVSSGSGFGQDAIGAPVYYRISEDRIFKSGDIRYFDHPKFGVVAKITRVEEEEDTRP